MSKRPLNPSTDVITNPVKPVGSDRQYKGQIEFDHDLYCCEMAEMSRNVAWSSKMKPIWEAHDHKHYFHTFDSDGREQTRCASALGHFHPMILTDNGPGKLKTVVCGPASKEVMAVVDGVYEKQIVELRGKEQHSHPVRYVTSERLTTRKANSEAMLAQSRMIDKETVNFTSEERKSIKAIDRGD